MKLDNTQLLERLDDLHDLTIKKRFQLAKPEQQECIDVLSSLIKSDFSNAEKVMALLPEFPSDVGAAALAKVWILLKTQKFPIFQTLRSVKFSSDLCKRLRLTLGCQLLSTSPADALRVLVDICQDMKQAKRGFPKTKDLNLICTALLRKGYSLLHKLPLTNSPESQVQLLVSYLLMAGFLAKSKGKTMCAQEVQLELLRWTKVFAKIIELPAEVVKAIPEAVKNWNDDKKKIVTNEMEALHAPIGDAIRSAVGTANDAERLRVPNALPVTKTQVQGDQPKPHYDPFYEIDRLVEHFKQREMLLKERISKLRETERELDVKRSELEVSKRDREELKRTLASERENLNEAHKEQYQLAKSRDAVVEELRIIKAALKDAESKHKATLQLHDKQLDNLSERIAREGDHRLETFKKKMESKLMTYGQSLQEAENMDMTEELGRALQIQMKQIVKILKSEGIDIEGSK